MDDGWSHKDKQWQTQIQSKTQLPPANHLFLLACSDRSPSGLFSSFRVHLDLFVTMGNFGKDKKTLQKVTSDSTGWCWMPMWLIFDIDYWHNDYWFDSDSDMMWWQLDTLMLLYASQCLSWGLVNAVFFVKCWLVPANSEVSRHCCVHVHVHVNVTVNVGQCNCNLTATAWLFQVTSGPVVILSFLPWLIGPVRL